MKLEELKPPAAKVIIDQIAYDLEPFSLDVQVWAATNFNTAPPGKPINGLLNLERYLNFERQDWPVFSNTVCDVVYYLLKDQDQFQSPCVFKSIISKAKDGGSKAIARLFMGLTDCIEKSRPIYDKTADEVAEIDLKKKLDQLQSENRGLMKILIGRGYTSKSLNQPG